ncbi:MAG: SIR2 family protein [Planctomycetes bacterium]|nr:SIR2 family protein [Planctomycetota bacterium]
MNTTLHALTRLLSDYREGSRRLIVWVGAGASRWNNLPIWKELTTLLEVAFQHSPGLPYRELRATIEAGDLASAMTMFKAADLSLYTRTITKALTPRHQTRLYARFLRVLDAVAQGTIITTNLDDSLDKGLPRPFVSRRDIARAISANASGDPIALKLHGTLGDSSSWVLTQEDYRMMLEEPGLLSNIRSLLAGSSIVFVGTGLQDAYLLRLLTDANSEAGTFGEGPHYWIAPSDSESPPSLRNILRIEYPIDHSGSHSMALHPLEALMKARATPEAGESAISAQPRPIHAREPSRPEMSTHVIFDPLPPGTYRSTNSVKIASELSGKPKAQIFFGAGFTQEEISDIRPKGLHDLLISLVCFDILSIPVDVIGRVHYLVGGSRFFALASTGAFRFLDYPKVTAVAYVDDDTISAGGLCTFDVRRDDRSQMQAIDRIRRQIAPKPEHVAIAQPLIDSLSSHVDSLTSDDFVDIQSQTTFFLANPQVRDALGITPDTPVGSIPPWQTFPVLRLATLLRAKATCSRIQASSAQLDYASDSLVDCLFSSTEEPTTAGDIASYVCVGSPSADLGLIADREPAFVDSVLAFRATDSARDLRRAISLHLAESDSAQTPFAINAALASFIPKQTLEGARASFSRIHAPDGGALSRPSPVLWTDARHTNRLSKWRQRSLAILEELQAKHRLADTSPCPCSSGLQIRKCCKAFLRSAQSA